MKSIYIPGKLVEPHVYATSHYLHLLQPASGTGVVLAAMSQALYASVL